MHGASTDGFRLTFGIVFSKPSADMRMTDTVMFVVSRTAKTNVGCVSDNGESFS
ncbi:MAG: hypothetical protein O3A46_00735 [Candidatus Poribacteria bacterium]|nr:hypothetical protein [Candidatus Poribacteria bacterium]